MKNIKTEETVKGGIYLYKYNGTYNCYVKIDEAGTDIGNGVQIFNKEISRNTCCVINNNTFNGRDKILDGITTVEKLWVEACIKADKVLPQPKPALIINDYEIY